MKKLIAVVLLIALALPASAQKWTVKTSAGYYPTVPTVASVFGAVVIGIAVSADEDSNEALDIEIPPFISVEALYSFNERWSVGINTGYTGCAWKVVNKDTQEMKSYTTLNLIPLTAVGRCNYLSRPAVKLYGSLELGAMFSVGGSQIDVVPSVQLNPIGVEFGSRFFGMVEAGVGMHYTGLMAGIGYRF